MIRRAALLAAALLGTAAAWTHRPLFLIACGCFLVAACMPRRTR